VPLSNRIAGQIRRLVAATTVTAVELDGGLGLLGAAAHDTTASATSQAPRSGGGTLAILQSVAFAYYPPAIAATTLNTSAPAATSSGSGSSAGSSVMSRPQAKKRMKSRRFAVP
jgi:hypothetical protein